MCDHATGLGLGIQNLLCSINPLFIVMQSCCIVTLDKVSTITSKPHYPDYT